MADQDAEQRPAFDATIVAAKYAAPIDQLVLALKFGNRLALAPLFARMLRDALLYAHPQEIALPTLLTAVPLGPRRLAERGFNQALEIAKPLSRAPGSTRISPRAYTIPRRRPCCLRTNATRIFATPSRSRTAPSTTCTVSISASWPT